SIPAVRAEIEALVAGATRLTWLRTQPIWIGAGTALVGVDGWSDARYGGYDASPVFLTDYVTIAELSHIDPAERLRRLNRFGDEEAQLLWRQLDAASERAERIIVLTHVPPFAAAAWHEGRQSDDDWLPHFSSKASGDVLLAAAELHPDRQYLVLCGHTHGE